MLEMENVPFRGATIIKTVIARGVFGNKPYESSVCEVTITDCSCFENDQKLKVVGDNDRVEGRILDACLCSMNVKEEATFEVVSSGESWSMRVRLDNLHFKGFVDEWSTKYKHFLAKHHKDVGVKLFKENFLRDAAFRFTKALKIISLIPIDVEQKPKVIEDVHLSDINSLKANLYHNLASCYFKKGKYNIIIELCRKVFIYDEKNVKAWYKIGVAYEKEKDFENAEKALNKALEIEPDNKACVSHLEIVKKGLREGEVKMDAIMKKMFEAI